MATDTTPEGWKIYFRKLLKTIAFVSVLILPTISMVVKDHVAKKPPRVIDNIPVAFALPVGIMEQWGYVLTKGFEQAFNWSGAKKTNNFSEYGMVFGARLAKELTEAEIRDPEIVANVHSFVDRCIFVRGAIGYPFTLEEVRDSTDLWELVRSKTRGVVTKWTTYEDGTRSLQNCTQGVVYLDNKLKAEGNDLISRLLPKYHYASNKKMNFLDDLGSVFGGDRSDAAKLITHHLMLNALNDVDNQYTDLAYGIARAKTSYEANAFISGATAKWSLTLWPPLYAIMNMVIDFAFDPAQIVSFGALADAQNKYDSIGAVASTMVAIVPFLAFWVTRMGEGGIMHMASPIMAAMSGATAAAGSEVAGNNRSLNNTQIGSESINNTSSNHHNTNFETVGGETSYNLSDGTMMRITAGGNQIISTGDGINQSKFASPITMRDDMQESIATALNQEQSNHKSISSSLEKGLSHQEQNIDNYVKGLDKHIDAGGRVNWNELGKNAQSVQNAVNYELQTGEGYSNRTEESAAIAMRVSGGLKVPIIGGAEVESSATIQNDSTQDTSLNQQNTKQEHWSKNFENVVEASSNKDFGKSWGADSNLTEDIQSTRASNMDLRQQEQLSKDRIDSLQQRAEEIRSFGSSYDVSATHLVEDKLVNGGMTQLAAQRLIDNPIRAGSEDRYKLNQARTAVRNELMQKISPVSSTNKVAAFTSSSRQHLEDRQALVNRGTRNIENASTEASSNVRNVANQDGVSKQKIESEVSKIQAQTSSVFKDIKTTNAKRNESTKALNEARLEQAAAKAKSAQPLKRAENAVNYVMDKLNPPNKR